MKTIVERIFFSLILLIGFTACEQKKDDPAATNNGELILRVSSENVRCVPRMAGMTALQFTWTPGTNNGTGSSIAYTLQVRLDDNTYENGMQFVIGRTMDRTLALSHRQLADTIAYFTDTLHTLPAFTEGQTYPMKARVMAKVTATGDVQISPEVPFSLVSFPSANTPLYLIGDATPNGWSMGYATLMNWDMTQPTLNTWQGHLRKGEYKILTSLNDWFPCYVRDSTDDGKMFYRAQETDYPDFKWSVAEPGEYILSADTKDQTLSVTCLYTETYSDIYMIGDATAGGWSWDAITTMKHPSADLFTYEGHLNAGQIKFPTEIKQDWTGEMLYAPVPDCAPSENGAYVARSGGEDNKWLIPEAGKWRITIDVKSTTISFKKL